MKGISLDPSTVSFFPLHSPPNCHRRWPWKLVHKSLFSITIRPPRARSPFFFFSLCNALPFHWDGSVLSRTFRSPPTYLDPSTCSKGYSLPSPCPNTQSLFCKISPPPLNFCFLSLFTPPSSAFPFSFPHVLTNVRPPKA